MQRIFALQSSSLLLQVKIILERLSGFCVAYRLKEKDPEDSNFVFSLLCDAKMNLEVPCVLPRMLLILCRLCGAWLGYSYSGMWNIVLLSDP